MPEYSMYDIFIGILHFFSEKENQFWYDKDNMQRFIHSEKEAYPILRGIPYDSDPISPRSTEIDHAYWTLIDNELILPPEPNMNPHYISTRLNASFKGFVEKKFTPEGLIALKELSIMFKERVSLATKLKS